MQVVAAMIEREGRLLVGQRRRGDRFALQWEFPGGKVGETETPERALERELDEELGVRAHVGRELYRTRHHYREMSEELVLVFFAARIEGEPANLAFEGIEWVERERLESLDFLPADREFVARLVAGDWAGE